MSPMIYACSHGVWRIQLNLSYIILYSVIERDIVVLNFNYSASIDLTKSGENHWQTDSPLRRQHYYLMINLIVSFDQKKNIFASKFSYQNGYNAHSC